MSGVLWGLLWASVLIVGAIVMLVVTPIRLGFTLRTAPDRRVRVTARLFGGLTPAIPIHDSAHAKRQPGTPPAAEKQRQAAPRRRRNRMMRMVRAAPSLLGRLFRKIRIEKLNIEADIGLEDPADTGQLFGLINALVYSRPDIPRVSIAIRPDFTGRRASGDVDAELSFIPAALAPPGLRFAWTVFGPRS